MLEYQIDTFGGERECFNEGVKLKIAGNSGSPVLRESDLVSIGAHVYGGTFNSASVIGKYGNPYNDYLAAFNLPVPNDGLNLIPVTGNTSINAPTPSGFGGPIPSSMMVSGEAPAGASKTRRPAVSAASGATRHAQAGVTQRAHAGATQHTQPGTTQRAKPGASQRAQGGALSHTSGFLLKTHAQGADEESFLDILKKAASIGAPMIGSVLNTTLPLALGPIGGPVGALAGLAFSAAGSLCESAEAEGFVEGTPVAHEGSMERAVLAEATLTALQSLELTHEVEEGIFSDMRDTVMKALPTVRKVAPKILGSMMEPALRIALDSLHTYNTKGAAGAESFEATVAEPFRPGTMYTHAIDQPVDRHAEAFLSHLHAAMEQHAEESAMDDGSAESFGDFFRAGVRLAGKGLSVAAQHGLPLLVQALAS